MEPNEEMWVSGKGEGKGLWQQMQEDNVVKFDRNKKFTFEELKETFSLLRKQDEERRVRMDKEYTDISKITLKEIEEVFKEMFKDEESWNAET